MLDQGLGGRWPVNLTRMRHQHRGRGVIFWAGIVGSSTLGPFKVEDGIKLNSEWYCPFYNGHFLTWLKSQTLLFRNKLVFMRDNAKSHAKSHARQWLHEQGIGNEKFMVCPPNSHELNTIENFWTIHKQKVYKNGRQYSFMNGLWTAIKVTYQDIESSIMSKLTNNVDRRLVEVLRNNGCHVKNGF